MIVIDFGTASKFELAEDGVWRLTVGRADKDYTELERDGFYYDSEMYDLYQALTAHFEGI